jgi:hypothetical protein
MRRAGGANRRGGARAMGANERAGRESGKAGAVRAHGQTARMIEGALTAPWGAGLWDA